MKLSLPITTFALLAASTAAAEQQPSNKRNLRSTRHSAGMYARASIGTRIVGGTAAAFNEYPSMAIPDYTSVFPNNQNQCGATLIHPDILMTAAHCQFDFDGQPIFEGWSVFIGGTQLSGADAVDNIAIASVHPHPEYNAITSKNDIMLIKLASPSVAQPAALNFEPTLPSDGETVTAIGFGATSEGGLSSEILQKVNVGAVDFQTCEAQYQLAGEQIFDEVMLCAGVPRGGKDSCNGDSGGPLFDSLGSQVGITSWGIGCAQADFPGVYARVSAFEEFIKETICELSDVPPEECEGGSTRPCTGTSINALIELMTDQWPTETSMSIEDVGTGEVLWTNPSITEEYYLYQFSECMDETKCYRFKIEDSFGDGLRDSSGGSGYFSMEYDGLPVASGSAFGSLVTAEFGYGCSPS